MQGLHNIQEVPVGFPICEVVGRSVVVRMVGEEGKPARRFTAGKPKDEARWQEFVKEMCREHWPTLEDALAVYWRKANQESESVDRGERESIATRLLALVDTRLRMFTDEDGDPYGEYTDEGGKVVTMPLHGKTIKDWLTSIIYDTEGRGLPDAALTEVRGTLRARANKEGIVRRVGVRVVRTDHGESRIDLGSEDWTCIRIYKDGFSGLGGGWCVDSGPGETRFRRVAGTKPIPTPQPPQELSRDSLLAAFSPHIAGGEQTVRMALGWWVSIMLGIHPYPILVLSGEQGSAKTSTAVLLKAMLDPGKPMLRSPPKEERDLVIACRNSGIVALDNLSHVPDWMADGLCRITTGSGFATRQLYTDGEEFVFDEARPFVLNGIPDLLARPDLADRAILLELPSIPDEDRRDAAAVQAAFQADHPRMLGILCELASQVLQVRDSIRLPRMPRMADYARTLAAIDTVLGASGWTLDPYLEGVRERATNAVVQDLLTEPLRKLAAQYAPSGWEGTATDLWNRLNESVNDEIRRTKHWPGAPHTLSNRLRRLAPGLRKLGIAVQHEGRNKANKGEWWVRQTRAEEQDVIPVRSGGKQGHQGHSGTQQQSTNGTNSTYDETPNKPQKGHQGHQGHQSGIDDRPATRTESRGSQQGAAGAASAPTFPHSSASPSSRPVDSSDPSTFLEDDQ